MLEILKIEKYFAWITLVTNFNARDTKIYAVFTKFRYRTFRRWLNQIAFRYRIINFYTCLQRHKVMYFGVRCVTRIYHLTTFLTPASPVVKVVM